MLRKSKSGKLVDIITSWDDGKQHDKYLHALLQQYDIPAIFYIPSINRDLSDDQIRTIAHTSEIGGHTVNHTILRGPHPDIVFAEVNDCKERMEEIIGRKITSFCYPRGRYDDVVKQTVRDAGFTEARTTTVLHNKRNTDPFELHTTCHVYPRKEYGKKKWHQIAVWQLNEVCDIESDANYFHL